MSNPESFVGGRRRVAPPLPTPGNNPNAPKAMNVTAAPFVPGGGGGGGSSPSASAPAAAAATNSSSTMAKFLNASAPSWQPKSASTSPPSAGGSPNAAVSSSVLQAATASISKEKAVAKAAASKMSAGALAFTPTKSDGGSFPPSPDKTPSSIKNKSTTTPNGSQQNGGPPPAYPSAPVAPPMPDPFKESRLALPNGGKAAAPSLQLLNTAWTLYAESKSWAPVIGGGGGGLSPAAAAAAAAHDTFEPTKLQQVNDVENFWRLLRGVPTPSTRSARFTYYFFRKTIFPSWEEPRNKNGGTFSFLAWDLQRGNTDKELLNDLWTVVLCGLVGESLDESMCINGVSVKVRKSTTIEFWTNTTQQRNLGRFAASLRKLIEERLPAFPQKSLEKMDFTSMETNQARSGNAPAPAQSQQQANSPGKGGGKKQQQQQQQQQQQHQQEVSTGPDFSI